MAESTPEQGPGNVPDPGESGSGGHDAGAPAWLMKRGVTIPEPPTRHVPRPSLTERCMPTRQRLTVLLAGGGFGKTTVLAACCREMRQRGIATAWLSLDGLDDPVLLDNYLVFAFQHAGVEVLEPLHAGDTTLDVPHRRMDLLLRAIEAHGGPCALVLDEVERLRDAESIALLNVLLQHAPARLHVALACRELPRGLNVALPVFEGRSELVTADDLRFSRAEIAEFFDQTLSRRELATVAADSAGWPMALRIHRNSGSRGGTGEARMMREVVENWVEARLWDDVSEGDRDFLLDVGLFEWVDGDLLDEVLALPDSMARLEAVSGLEGLLEPVRDGASSTWRLHPLIREHCVRCRLRETPERYRSLQRRIAEALARRGETVSAMAHAAQGRDPELVGRILRDAGALRLWLREGGDRLVLADRYLSAETLAAYPELALVRCVARVTTGRLRDARREFDLAMRQSPRDASAAGAPALDRYLVRGLMAHVGCEWIGTEAGRALVAETARIAETSTVDPAVRGLAEYGLCFAHNHSAEFEAAVGWGDAAKRRLGDAAPYVRVGVDFQLGQVAMAQGRVRDAIGWYRRARALATERFLREPRLAVYGKVLAVELDLERNRVEEGGGLSMDTYRACSQFSAYAAASEIGAELKLESEGEDAALATVDEMLQHAREAELPMLLRYLSGLRVSLLADAGRIGEAERTWRDAALPDNDDGCLDLRGQSWREMEALACGRLRWLAAAGRFDAARQFAAELVAVATGRGLRRTRMRALALASVAEERGGNRRAARKRLAEFLRLFVETDYARSLVRHRETVVALCEPLLAGPGDATLRASALALVDATRIRGAVGLPKLSVRERDVLVRLDRRDREIAAALGLSRDGVRYHVRSLFRKLEVHGRREAVRRARELGIMPERL